MKQSGFPPGWDAERVKRVLAHYESQNEMMGTLLKNDTLEIVRIWSY